MNAGEVEVEVLSAKCALSNRSSDMLLFVILMVHDAHMRPKCSGVKQYLPL